MTPPTSKPTRRWGVGTWLAIVLVGLPLGIFFNLVTVSALVSGGVLGYRHVSGAVVTGVITDSVSHTVPSRRGPDESYCYGLFRPDDDNLAVVRVRIYVVGFCFRAKGETAELVYGAATPLTDRMSDRSGGVGGPMPFNGLFGMTPGAIVDQRPFWRGLWPFLFLAPVAAVVDIAAIVGIRGRVRRRGRGRRPR